MLRRFSLLVALMVALAMVLAMPVFANYLPTMPPASGIFGKVCTASPSFNDGYHWDDPATPTIDERDIPEHYTMPSPMPGYTAGDTLDYHWVWVNGMYDYVIWEFKNSVYGVRVYPSQDHGPYLGMEFDEYTVYGSNDQVTWNLATQTALYYDNINNIRTHDGVKDYTFNDAAYKYKYIKIAATHDGDFELDAVEALMIKMIKVSIDIKPGSFPNSINLGSKGNVPVAILSSPAFDATTVDRNTVIFAGASPLSIGQTPEDVNGDGLLDVVLHFKTQDLNLQPGDTEACLTGKTLAGQDIEGCDSVRIVK